MFKTITSAALAATLLSPAGAMAADPAVKCEAGKLKESSKYSACRLKAESKAVLKGIDPDYTKCDDKLTDKWAKIETKADGACVDTVLDTDMQGFLTANSDAVAAALDGGTLPSLACGNGVLDPGEDCDLGTLGGADCDLATGGAQTLGNLTCSGGCVFDTTGCTAIRFEPQNVAGERTVIDHQTGLEWVVPDVKPDPIPSWSWTDQSGGTLPTGTLFTEYLSAINAATYGGHADWRIPEIEELETIVDQTKGACAGEPYRACLDETLFGPVGWDTWYWSNTEDPSDPINALVLEFDGGSVGSWFKWPFITPIWIQARAVRNVF